MRSSEGLTPQLTILTIKHTIPMRLTQQYLQLIYRIRHNPYLKATLFYILEWLKSFSLELQVGWIVARITLLNLHIHISNTTFRIVFSLPKYGLILTTETSYYYQYEGWYFYKKPLIGNLSFYVMHIIGEDISRLDEVLPLPQEIREYDSWQDHQDPPL